MSDFKCVARQYSDQKVCNRCGYTWDTNDPAPPVCKTDRELSAPQAHAESLKAIRKTLGDRRK